MAIQKKMRNYEIRVNVDGRSKAEMHKIEGTDISNATKNANPELTKLYGEGRYKIVSIVEV
jgi:hypothetical protein